MKTSPTQRSLKDWRSRGWTCQVVEHFNPYVCVRQDLFGFIDILAMKEGEGIVGIQTTSDNGGNMSKHLIKINSLNTPKIFLGSGGKIVIEAWGKKGARGKRKLWTVRRLDYQG